MIISNWFDKMLALMAMTFVKLKHKLQNKTLSSSLIYMRAFKYVGNSYSTMHTNVISGIAWFDFQPQPNQEIHILYFSSSFFLSGCFFNIQCSITSDSEVNGTVVNEEILNGNLQFQENSTKSFGWKKHSDTFTAKHNKKNTSWTGKFTQIYLYFMKIKHEVSMCICCSFTTAWTAHFWRFYPVCQDHLRIYIFFLCSKDGFMQQKWLKFKPNLVCVYFTASQN